MEKEIHRHLEAIEDMEEKLDNVLEKMFLNLDVKEIMEDPVLALGEFVETLEQVLDEDFHDDALKEGIKFAKNIKRNDVIKN